MSSCAIWTIGVITTVQHKQELGIQTAAVALVDQQLYQLYWYFILLLWPCQHKSEIL